MKSSLATSLSIVGVLAAGGVAMGLNTAVLTSKSGGSDLVQQLVDEAAATGTTLLPTGVIDAAAAPEGDTTTFTIGTAGTVTVTVTGASLEVTDITAGAGWTASSPRYEGMSMAKVHFTSAAQRLEVYVTVVDGVPQVKVEDETGAPAPGYPESGEGHHDDDDDHEEHEEHEDEDHDDDEDEHDEGDDD